MNLNIKQIIADIAFNSGLIRLVKFIRNKCIRNKSLIILCYHRISSATFLISPQCISPIEFKKQVEFFRKHFDIWPLANITEYLQGNLELSKDTLVFTFDDGYLDNYENAIPILDKHRIPATFFVSTDPMFRGKNYWLDLVGYCLASLDETKILTQPVHDRAFTAILNKYMKSEATFRNKNARAVLKYLINQEESDGKNLISYLINISSFQERFDDLSDFKVMNVDQIKVMLAKGYHFGGHGVTHWALSKLQKDRCRHEILNSISEITAMGINVTSFAYPFGGPEEVGALPCDVLSQTNIKLGLTTEERAVSRNDNPLKLPRKVISPQSLGQIALKLENLAWKA